MISKVRKTAGWWLPASDRHMAEWLFNSEPVDGRGTYQYTKFLAALARVRRFRMAVDVGAHVGTWSWRLAALFEKVYAFEPVTLHAECWRKNLADVRNAVLLPVALGDATGKVAMETNPENTGESWVRLGVPGMIPVVRLDDVVAQEPVDFLKIDCEGYEPLVLGGAMRIVRRDLPVVIVEQDDRYAERHGIRARAAVDLLVDLGYEVAEQITCDYVLVHPESVHAGQEAAS